MVRIKRARGGWDDGNAKPPPGHFERADGRVMTQEEIAAAVKGPTDREVHTMSTSAAFANQERAAVFAAERAARASATTSNGPVSLDQPAPTPSAVVSAPAETPPTWSRRPVPDADVDAAWAAYLDAPTGAEAARRVGVTPHQLDARIRTYMQRHGLTGKPADHRRASVMASFERPAKPPKREHLIRPPKPRPAPERLTDPGENDASVSSTNGATEPIGQAIDAIADRLAETAGRLEAIHHDLEDGWAQELSEPQARLVLVGALKLAGSWDPLETTDKVLASLRRHGFDLVIRLGESKP